MSLRTRIFIIISIAILLILGVSILLVVLGKKKSGETIETPPQIIDQANIETYQPAQPGIPDGLPVKEPTPLEVEQNWAKQTAEIFVERYGSYSTDNNYQNIKDVQSLVTSEFWTKLSAKMAAPVPKEFYGVTVKVITNSLTDWKDNSATMEMRAIRTELKNGQTINSYKNASVSMVKQDEKWLVNSLVWK